MAKATPDELPAGVKIAVLIPITRPAESSNGPPLLPGLMLASGDGTTAAASASAARIVTQRVSWQCLGMMAQHNINN